ncbi:GGDEF domain-containing protein [Desulfobacca acetoxidans]
MIGFDAAAILFSDPNQRDYVWILVSLAVILLVLGGLYYFIARLTRKVAAAQEKLVKMASVDDLTRLHNRRFFFEQFGQEVERAKRYRRSLSCIMLDIDHFKAINDTYGHLLGDQLLIDIAQILHDNCRLSDLAARYGGDELIVLLPETEAAGAIAIAERIRKLVAQHQIVGEKGEVIRATVSIGVASLGAGQLQDIDHYDRIIRYADDALYRAKTGGRNRTEHYQQTV